jgi:hypothetical protein
LLKIFRKLIPPGPHRDWIWPLSSIPRSWTAFESKVLPRKLGGTQEGHLDVPDPGKWAIMGYGPIPVMWAYTTHDGMRNRFGILRYDYEDHYWEIFTAAHHPIK